MTLLFCREGWASSCHAQKHDNKQGEGQGEEEGQGQDRSNLFALEDILRNRHMASTFMHFLLQQHHHRQAKQMAQVHVVYLVCLHPLFFILHPPPSILRPLFSTLHPPSINHVLCMLH